MQCALVALLAVGPASAARAAGHSHAPINSAWTLNVQESDFGGGPTYKSDVMTILVDTDKWLKWTDVSVEGDGKTSKTSWSGPQDGSLKPVGGMAGAKASFRTADDSGHMLMPDGTTVDSVFTIGDDKKTVTMKMKGKTSDGKTFKQRLVYQRSN